MNKLTIFLLLLLSINAHASSQSTAKTLTTCNDIYAKTNLGFTGYAHHFYSITNRSGKTQSYLIVFRNFAVSSMGMNELITIPNGETRSAESGSKLSCIYPKAGTYKLSASTQAVGNDGAHDTTECTSNIIVSD